MLNRQVTIVGSVNADLTIELPRVAQPGETLLGTGGRLAIGGKGFNQAFASRRFGTETALVAAIGDDAFGQQAQAELARIGIDARAVRSVSVAMTGSAAILVTPGGVNTIAVCPGANVSLAPEHVGSLVHGANSAIVVAQLEVPIESVAAAFRAAKAAGATTILNPAPSHPDCLRLLSMTDILVPNEHELADLTGIARLEADDSLRQACRRLAEEGVGTVVATLGARGCAIFQDETLTRIPAFAVQAVDTSGAGDTFVGTLAASLAEGADLGRAIIQASAASALSVTQAGAASAPARADLDAFLTDRTELAALAPK